MTDKDVTGLVKFGWNDDGCLPLVKCVCGAEFEKWTHNIWTERDDADPCPQCGRRLYWRLTVTVFEVQP